MGTDHAQTNTPNTTRTTANALDLSGIRAIRKIYHSGHSHQIGLPAAWIRKHHDPNTPYASTTITPDGNFVVFATIAPDQAPQRPSDTP